MHLPNWDRYVVLEWDEFLRLYCNDCPQENGDEVACYPSSSDPVSLLHLIADATAHENKFHSKVPPAHP